MTDSSSENDAQWESWLLRARVTPPRDLHQLIPRPRVVQALTAAAIAPIVAVNAPPGFGKTAALAEWCSAMAGQGIRTAWLTLDSEDDPESVLRYLAFALHVAGSEVAEQSGELPRELQALLATVERSGQRWVLALDDLDVASEAVVTRILNPLLRFLPQPLTLAVAMRSHSAIDLSGPMSRACVRWVDRRDLRFDRDEIKALWGRSATAAQIRAVERRSEGWPALVQLMREHGAALHFHNTGTDSFFFESRVLQRLDPAARNLLQKLSILSRYTLDLVTELTGSPGLPESLSEMGIVRTDKAGDGTQKYYTHPLFREYVAEQFAAADPQGVLKMRYAAARAYMQRELHAEAVQVAVATGDPAFIGEIVEACDPVLTWIHHGTSRLRPLVRRVPDSVLSTHRRVGYGRVIYWVKEGRLQDAQSLFDRLEQLPNGASRDTRELLERGICHSMLAIYKGTPISKTDIAQLEQLAPARPDLAPTLGYLANTMHCYLQQHNSQFAPALESARRAIRDAELARSPYAAFYEYCDLAMINGVLGDAATAFALFEQGERACRSSVRADERLSLIRDAFRLEIEHEINPLDVSEIARLRNLFLRLPRLEAWLDVFAAVYRTYTEKLLLQKNLTAALAVIDAGLAHVREQQIANVPIILQCQRAFLLARAGNATEARAAIDEIQRHSPLQAWRQTECLIEAQAALDILQGTKDSLPRLQEAVQHANSTSNVRSELRFRRLRSILSADRDDSARIAELEAQTGYKRASVLYTQPPLTTDENAPASELFTPREVAVLEKLEEGLTDKSIAVALGITAHGVRHHLKRIYMKLNVRDRAEARSKARQAGLRFQNRPH